MKKDTIPKVIHYCWFGNNEKSDLIKKCLESWKNHLPDYEIIEWNEKNFDVNINKYTEQAYKEKKFAFVSDYARLWVIYNYGGIYLDTDVEVLKNLDCFLANTCFMAFEGDHGVNLGLIFGALKGNKVIKEIMNKYENCYFINEDNTVNTKTIVHNTTEILINYGLTLDSTIKQCIEGIQIYPSIYFCPDKRTRENLSYRDETFTVHHYDASWVKESHKKRLNNPFWCFFFRLAIRTGKKFRIILGNDRWEYIRDKYLKLLYNFVRGE